MSKRKYEMEQGRDAKLARRQAEKLMKAIRSSGVGRLKHISLSEGMSMSLTPFGMSHDFIWVRSNKENPASKPERKAFDNTKDYNAAYKAWKKTDLWIARQELKKAMAKLHQAGIRFCEDGSRYLQVYNCHNRRLIK